nr:hypothetical protein [Tanacetum cinerariifolium]
LPQARARPGRGYGNGHHLRVRLHERYSARRPAAGERQSHDARGRENVGIGF